MLTQEMVDKLADSDPLKCMYSNIHAVLNMKQMCKVLQVSRETMGDILNGKHSVLGPPPAYRIGRDWRCNTHDFFRWVKSLPVEYSLACKRARKK